MEANPPSKSNQPAWVEDADRWVTYGPENSREKKREVSELTSHETGPSRLEHQPISAQTKTPLDAGQVGANPKTKPSQRIELGKYAKERTLAAFPRVSKAPDEPAKKTSNVGEHDDSSTVESSNQDVKPTKAPTKTEKNDSADPRSEQENQNPKQWRKELRRVIGLVELQLRSDELSRDDKLALEQRLRMLYAADDRRERAASPIANLEKTRRQFWTQWISGAMVMLDAEGNPRPDQRATRVLSHLRKASMNLADEGILELKNLTFCSKVDGYGRYTAFSRYRFRPDQEVLLYVEIDSYSSKQVAGSDYYETVLQGAYDIYDLTGRRVSKHRFPEERDRCRNRRRDFYSWYRVYIPRLKPGEYTLQLTVEDRESNKMGQTEAIRFTVLE